MSSEGGVENVAPFTGHIGHLSEDQVKALNLLKLELKEAGQFLDRHDDYLLCKFLRARKYDVAKAKTMLVECDQWRVEFKVDELVKSFVYEENAVVNTIYPRYYHKTDKEGRPVYIEHLGKLNIKTLMQITTQERILQHYVVEYEKVSDVRFPACSKVVGHRVETSTTILDLKNVPLMQFAQVYNFVKQVTAISQNYYPESLGKMFLINSPMFFSTVWNMIKGLLDEVTANKIHILGSDYSKTLLEHIDADSLPVCFGGNCSCQDQGGCEASDAGPWNVNGLVEK